MHRDTKIIIVTAGVLLFGVISGYLCAHWQDRSGVRYDLSVNEDVTATGHWMPDGSWMGPAGMGMGHMMMVVESEREFLEGMIPHHQEAVYTAKEVIARGGSTPEIKQLVENIVVAQEREIREMKEWYEAWYGVPYVDTGTYEPMMRDLSTLSGAALDTVFLEDMIGHHMGAIMMAQSVQPYVEHSEIEILTQAIVTTQSAEIAQMRLMLRGVIEKN